MPLKRDEAWVRKLHDFLVKRAPMPFVWGANDCALFAADAIWSFTGVDIADQFRAKHARRRKDGTKRGSYSDAVGALGVVHEVTGNFYEVAMTEAAAQHCAAEFGLPELHTPKLAQRGDLLVMEDAGRLVAGIVSLNGREGLSVGEHGLMRLPIACWRRAWRVG